MIVTVAAFKGGVGKTTSSVHIASYLQTKGPTLLVDGDPNRSSLAWKKRGELPFPVVDESQASQHVGLFKHLVIDTAARPTLDELYDLVNACDLMVIPSIPDALSIHALLSMTKDLAKLNAKSFKVLLTMIPPRPSRDGAEAMLMLEEAGLPHFATGIRRAVAFPKAALAGVPVNEVNDPRAGLAWEDYERIGREIYGE